MPTKQKRNYKLETPNAAQKRAKQRIIKPTGRQKLAAKLRSENPIASDKSILLQAGYDESTALVPSLITNSVGYKQELAQYGLTEELITSSLVEDIEKKPQKRARELELGADILQMRRRIEAPNQTLNIALFSTEQQNRIAQRIIESIGNKPQNTENT